MYSQKMTALTGGRTLRQKWSAMARLARLSRSAIRHSYERCKDKVRTSVNPTLGSLLRFKPLGLW